MSEKLDLFAHPYPIPLDGGRVGLRLSSTISMADEPTEDSSWVHFAPFGVWKGHEEGEFRLDKEVFDSVIARFEDTANDVQVDYNHDSIKEQLGYKPAAGWIKALEVRGNGKGTADGLWGLVEWTKRAAAFIRNKEYKYTSPVIDFKSKDRKTGKVTGPELFNAALTNDPFLDGQVPLALERLPLQMEIKIKDKQEGQAVAASQEENKDATALQEEGMGSSGAVDKIAEAVGLEPSAVEAILLEKMDDIVAIVAGAQNQDGTPADEAMTSDQTSPTVAADKWAQAEKGKEQLELSRLSSRVKELETDKRKALEKKVSEHVAAKIENGEIPDQSKALAEELYLEDWDRAEKIYCSKIVPIGVSQSTKGQSKKGQSANLNDVEKESVAGLVLCGYTKEKATERIVAQRKAN